MLAAPPGPPGSDLLDLHADAGHHRAVLTVAGEAAPRAVAAAAVDLVDLRRHRGARPRIGAVDVVPFAPVESGAGLDEAFAARDRFAAWSPNYAGSRRTRTGPTRCRSPSSGEASAGCGPPTGDRSPIRPPVRWRSERGTPSWPTTSGWPSPTWPAPGRSPPRCGARRYGPSASTVGHQVQVSCNLVDPLVVGPAEVHDAVAARVAVARCELVGLVPAAVSTRCRPSGAPPSTCRRTGPSSPDWPPAKPVCERSTEHEADNCSQTIGFGLRRRRRPSGRWRGRGGPGGARGSLSAAAQTPLNFSPLARAYSRHSFANDAAPGTPPWPPSSKSRGAACLRPVRRRLRRCSGKYRSRSTRIC